MGPQESIANKPTCFVVMGFGKKTDFETGKVFDLDKSYRNMIKPAVEAAGLVCIRADEIVHSGLIDVPMYEQLLNADVVVADLSTSNKNAFYELGVRHALRPFTTIIIAEDGIKTFPFDVNHIAVRQYHHLGEDIGFDEVMRFRKLLTDAIVSIQEKNPHDKDSPVYTFINGLTPPAIAVIQATIQAAVDNNKANNALGITEKYASLAGSGASSNEDLNEAITHSVLMQQVDEAQNKGDWATAKALLTVVRQMIKDEVKRKQEMATVPVMAQPEDPYLLQRLALITYKSKLPTEKEALLEADNLLHSLNPSVSNDTETLGLWGSVHKRLHELTNEANYLDEAIRAYERGFYIKNDYYNGINFAFLLNARAVNATDRAEAITDFVCAQRTRKEVLEICEQLLKQYKMPDKDACPAKAMADYLNGWYWIKATMAEANLGLDDEVKANEILAEAYGKAPYTWMKTSTEEQLAKLKLMLEKSPLQYIKED